ncbi:MAG: hypothetical protein ACRDNJ_14210 [Solirubrobacteraceae bacterium]
MSFRHHRVTLVIPILLAALALGGCGASLGGSGHQAPQVAISLTAPMTGATVGVNTIKVTGTVTPANASVRVGGLPATVRGAGFTRALSLHTETTTIPVTAVAPGWNPATVSVTVHYSRTLAHALTAARSATWLASAPASSTTGTHRPRHAGFLPSVDLNGGGSGSARSGGGGTNGGGGQGGGGSADGGGSRGGSPTGTPPGAGPTGTPTTGSPTGLPTTGSPTGTPPTGEPAAPPTGGEPVTPAPVTQAELEQMYLASCKKAAGGAPAEGYCMCMYDRIQRAQVFSSPARLLALARRIERFNRTHDLTDLPKWLRDAQATCVAQLPSPPVNLGRLPALHHPAAPARGGPSGPPPVLGGTSTTSSGSPLASGTPAAPGAPATSGTSAGPGSPAPAARHTLSPGAGIVRLTRRLRHRLLLRPAPRGR